MNDDVLDAIREVASIIETVRGIPCGTSDHYAGLRVEAMACVSFLRTHHATIRDMAARLEAAERDAARWRAFLSALRTKLHGPGHGNRIKVVEVCPMYGDEKEINDITSSIDAAMQETGR